MVCPRALGRLTAVLDALGELAEQIVPTGSAAQIAAATRTFGVFSRRAPDPDDPAMPHTALTYVLDRHGRYAMHFPDALEPEKMTERLRTVLRDTDTPGGEGRTTGGASGPAR